MRVRTRSACAALAWGIIVLIMTAAGPIGSPRPAPATTRIASSTSSTSNTRSKPTITRQATSTSQATLTSSVATILTAGGTGSYTVRPGDTLSGIASALGTRGGWPALYEANRQAIGPDPDAIHAGNVLVIPRSASPASNQAPTLSPHSAQTPTRTPASALPSAPAAAPAGGPGSAKPSTGARPHPGSAGALSTGGLPRWLVIVLVAAGLLIATAFLTEPVLAIARRRHAGRPAPADPHIVLADYERLVVTHSRQDGTVYVLRPPNADPQAILLAARLVLAQDRYEALAGHLGVPAHWPRE